MSPSSSPAIRFELLAERHLPAILDIERQVNGSAWSEQSFRNEISHDHGRFVVAMHEDVLVGYLAMWLIVDEVHIPTIAVDPNRQRGGIGRQMLTYCLDLACEASMTCATLEVRAGNTPALRLYEWAGFQRAAIRKRYYPDNQEDAVVMWLHHLDSWQAPR